MKQRLLIVLFTCIIATSVSAQIQRKFYGLTLGVSTKSEVLIQFENKGAFEQSPDGHETVCVRNLRFGGYSWDVVVFRFYNDKLFNVLFMDLKEYPSTDSNKWENIKKTLDEKYIDYKNVTSENSFSYIDEYTYLACNHDGKNVCLGYADILLNEKISQKEKDEF